MGIDDCRKKQETNENAMKHKSKLSIAVRMIVAR